MKIDNQVLIEVSNRRRDLIKSKESLPWAFINLTCAFIFFIDFYNGFSRQLFPDSLIILIDTLECFLMVILIGNTIFDLLFYCWPYFWMKPIPLTPTQKRLLGIKENEIGFTDYVYSKDNNQNQVNTNDSINYLPKFTMTPDKALSPLNSTSSISANRSLTPSSAPQSLNSSGYFVQQQKQYSSTPNASLNQSSFIGSTEASSWSFHAMNTSSPYINETSVTSTTTVTSITPSLRKRSSISYKDDRNNSSFIKDESSLREYLYSYEEMEEKMNCVAKDDQQTQYYPIQQGGSPVLNQSQMSSLSYQAARDVTTVAPKIEEISSISNLKAIEEFAGLLNTNETHLYKWIENIRSWISQTILLRVSSEIDRVNETLSKTGLNESLIGEIGLSALKQLASLKAKEIPFLSALVPYLDLSSQQEYLVQRIKDLAKGGCMSEFNWNRGTYFKGKQWSEDLPTDAQIVIHLFCRYLDSSLPPNTNCPDGKPFTNTYFKSSISTSSHNSNTLYILEVKTNPPHYNVVVDGVAHEIPTGRNNIFYALIYFLHNVKLKRFGLLGRVNLGPSGVNILWTIMD